MRHECRPIVITLHHRDRIPRTILRALITAGTESRIDVTRRPRSGARATIEPWHEEQGDEYHRGNAPRRAGAHPFGERQPPGGDEIERRGQWQCECIGSRSERGGP